jgi:protein phosphatase 2C family protein 2/3
VNTFSRIDDCLLSDIGRRIVFNNLKLKEVKKPYVFPENVDFDQKVTLDANDHIDKCIIREKEFHLKHGKLPDYMNNVEEEPKQGKLSGILQRTNSLNSTDAGGCTANVGLIKGGVLYLANAGDSRAIAYTLNGKTLGLSEDHKPENREERQRIESADGFVEDNRVNGNLALSRAFGDFT